MSAGLIQTQLHIYYSAVLTLQVKNSLTAVSLCEVQVCDSWIMALFVTKLCTSTACIRDRENILTFSLNSTKYNIKQIKFIFKVER